MAKKGRQSGAGLSGNCQTANSALVVAGGRGGCERTCAAKKLRIYGICPFAEPPQRLVEILNVLIEP